MFGTQVKVKLGSVWENVRKKRELSTELTESEIEKNENASKTVEEPKQEDTTQEEGEAKKNEND